MEDMNLKETQLTDEQIDDIANQLDEEIKGTSLENIAKFPSNNGKLERTKEEITEKGTTTKVQVAIDPNSGEHKIIGPAPEKKDKDDETFEEMLERLENEDIKTDNSPITRAELKRYLDIASNENSSILSEIINDNDEMNPDSIKKLLDIVNRKMNKEDFSIYREFPDDIKNMIDKYMKEGGIPLHSTEGKQFRNMISEQLIDEFISNITMDRIKNDFNKEIEDLFSKGTKEIADSIVGYTMERNKSYREYAEKMEDEEKKKKVISILDSIDMAYELTTLKEFAKKCKIKSIELEKAESRIYNPFLAKYRDSIYNIYDINLARPVLMRNLSELYPSDNITAKDIDSFFICFCKECNNKKSNDPLDHAYMYYVLYNIVLTDMNKGENAEISVKFLANVKEVIDNIRTRNNY